MIRTIRKTEEVLGLLSRGKFSEKCDEHLTEAITALEALPSGKGTATITITLTLAVDGERLDMKPTVKSKLPEEKAFAPTPFWVHDGGLSTQHPSQADMFIRPVAEKASETA